MSSPARDLLRDLLATPRRFRDHNALHLCAGVAFYSLLSLPPLVYLAAALIDRLWSDADARARLVEELAAWLPPNAAESLGPLVDSLRVEAPVVLLAFPALIWAATTVFASLHLAVNVAFERAQGRSVVRGRLKAFALLALGLFALLVNLVAATALPAFERVAAERHLLPEGMPLAVPLSRLALLTIPFLLFAAFYKLLPRGSVAWRSSLSGALLALVLWEALRRAFGSVLTHSPALGLLSGTLSGIVVVLLWVYGAVAVVVLGAEFAALRDDRRRLHVRDPKNG